jgi:hypothetical protein
VGALNDGFRFLLELAGLAAVGYWGLTVGGPTSSWILGIGAPLTFAIVWGLFVAPKASMRTTDPQRLLMEAAVFGSAVAALVAAGRPELGALLAAAVVLHLGLTFPLDQR